MECIYASRHEAKRKLEWLFETSREGLLLLSDPSYRHHFVFDFDGVLLKECGVAEVGYAWLVRAFREDNWRVFDIDINIADQFEAKAFRPNIKGKSPIEKVEILRDHYGTTLASEIHALDAVYMWFEVMAGEIKRRFGSNPTAYLLPGAKNFVSAASRYGHAYGLTANIQNQAEYLMQFVELQSFFQQIIGYPPEARAGTTKATMLQSLLHSQGVEAQSACYIGDGVPDMRAAHEAGVLAIGVANDLENGLHLLEEGCDVLCTGPSCGEHLISMLTKPGEKSA